MTIESLIGDAVVERITPEIDGLITTIQGRDALLTELLAKQDAILASHRALLDAVRALGGGAVPPPVDPPPVDPPAPVPADPPGSVRWQGALWAIFNGVIVRDGKITPETSLTKDVRRLYIGDNGVLRQVNAAGSVYEFSGGPHWKLIPTVPDFTISGSAVASGSIQAP